MKFDPTPLKGSYLIELSPIADDRGWFARTYCRDTFEKEIGHNKEWVQMNHSFTVNKGAVRGMHFQVSPYEEIKMVRCIAGAVFDVIVDLRTGSDTFLKWFGAALSAENKRMMYIPEGFAHGFQALSENAELVYSHTQNYQPSAERGLLYNDPALNIEWPLAVTDVSQRDKNHPLIRSDFKF
jgi:dTDP-4-dehydrorhamnose 3,5-epimerase